MKISYKPELPKTPRPICIVGAGGIVNDAHLPAYQLAGLKVAGICDINRERAEKLAAKFNVPVVCSSVDELVAASPVNAVFDIAIMASHFAETLARLPDGAPVLIQKPMGESLAQAREILDVCRRKKLIAAVNFQLRFAPFVSAARWLIDHGHIGDVYDMEVRVSVQTPWDLFPAVKVHPRLEILYHSVHYIDLVRSFFGNPKSVLAKTVGHPAKSLSSTRSALLFDYGDKRRALVSTNHDHDFGPHNQESYIKWEGTKGAIKAKMGLLMNYPHGVPDKFEFCRVQPGKPPAWEEQKLESSWFPHGFIGTMSSLQRFVEGSDKALPTSVEDVIHTMAVVEAAYESSDQGGVRPMYAA
jgi:predicted dehydrogenase